MAVHAAVFQARSLVSVTCGALSEGGTARGLRVRPSCKWAVSPTKVRSAEQSGSSAAPAISTSHSSVAISSWRPWSSTYRGTGCQWSWGTAGLSRTSLEGATSWDW